MTIRDVAEYCGVSISTVSRVLNNRPDVSSKVRKKVLDAVEYLHYVPNNSARDLVKTTSDSIGVIVRGAGNLFFSSMLHSIEETADRLGYSIISSQIPSFGDELATGASLARSRRLNGLIFLGGRFDYNEAMTALLDVPFVCCTFTNSFGDLDKEKYSSVSIDDRAEAAKAVRYLIDRGHRNIAIILDSAKDHSIGQLRYMGYCDALSEAGIELDSSLVEEIRDYDMSAAYNGTKRLLARRSDITAIFVIADALAIAVIKSLYDSNIRVPDDCSVIAIDGIDSSLYTVPTLTTLIQPRDVLGKEAVKALVNVIEGKSRTRHIRLETDIRTGATVLDIRTWSSGI